jgi:HEAT repeat protein
MTVSGAVAALKSASSREQRVPLGFLSTVPVTAENRDEVIAAVKPLLNDVDSGAMAFDVFTLWAGQDQVPDLIEMMRIAPNSQRGNKCMNLLSRMGDARAAGPLAECLTDFHVLRHAKAALAALGDIAKPAVLPYHHHEDRSTREAARELLRGYKVTDEEIFAESIKALESGTAGARQSAMFDLPKSKLTPAQQAAAARAMRPLVTGADEPLRNAARQALKTLATPADADFLLEQLDSTDDATRQFATELLVRMKDARAAKPIAVLLSDSHKTHAAGRALISLGSAAEPAVVPYLRHKDPNTRKRAAEVLTEIGTSACLPALKTLEKDENFFAKAAAARAVAAIQSRPSGRRGQ